MSVLQPTKIVLFASSSFALTLILTVGCKGLKESRSNQFVKPLSAASSSPKVRRQLIPDERTLCMETAKTVAEKGYSEEAIKLYQRAEELGPSPVPLDRQLAPLYAQAGEFDSAIERYKRLVSTSPRDTELCNNAAWSLMEAERYEEAIAEAKRGLAFEAGDKRLLTTLAMIHYRQGDRTSALAQFAKAEDPTTAHHNLAVLDIDAGNLQSAREHLRLAGELALDGPDKVSPKTEALVAAINQQSARHLVK